MLLRPQAGILAGSAFAALALAGAARAATPSLALDWPIACEIGKTCFIQHYVDDDPGPAAHDYMCGTLTYQGHNGIDIRVPTLAAMKAGVNVLAAAPGTVAATRDGMPDVSVTATDAVNVTDRECGNGVRVTHADGWETQYCHMQEGSIRVKQGETVTTGEVLGHVGLSGNTEFPHLHITVRHDGEVVDPFAFGAAPGSCGGGQSLWAPAIQATLAYRAPAVLNAGFATGPVTMDGIEAGAAEMPVDTASGAMVAFVRAIGLRDGDEEKLTLTAPDGTVLAVNAGEPFDRPKDQTMMFTGKRLKATAWPKGTYTAIFTVTNAGKVVLEYRFTKDL